VQYPIDRAPTARYCSVTFGASVASCRPIWLALTGGPPKYAAIPTVSPGQVHETQQWDFSSGIRTYRGPHLELRPETLAQLKMAYPRENYDEGDWDRLMSTVSEVAMLGTALVALLAGLILTTIHPPDWSRPRRSLAPLASLASSLVVGVVTGGLVHACLLWIAMGTGLVD
jgi:hypothetical protein